MGLFHSTESRPLPNPTPHIRPSKDSRIVIIGAGPAGIHMALLLKKKGYHNVTILEKANRVGGKIWTVESAGVVHEMGACWLSPDYDEIRKLLDIYDGGLELRPGGRTGERAIQDEQNKDMGNMDNWIYGEVQKIAQTRYPGCFGKFVGELPSQISIPRFVIAVEKYEALHHRVFGGVYNYHFPPMPSKQNMKYLEKTLGQLLREEGMEALIPAITIAQAAQGYGFLDTIPAYYGLLWMTPKFWRSFINHKLGNGPYIPTLLEKGFQNLFNAIYTTEKLNVVFNFTIESITRNWSSKTTARGKQAYKDPIVITGRDYDSKESRDIKADFLFLAAPYPELKPLFTDLHLEEQDYINALQPLTMTTNLISCRSKPDESCVTSWPHALTPAGMGHIYSMRSNRLCLYPQGVPIKPEYGSEKTRKAKYADGLFEGHVPGAGPNRVITNLRAGESGNEKFPLLTVPDPGSEKTDQYVTYQITDEPLYAQPDGAQKSTAILEQDLKDRGREEVNVLLQLMTPYFYHFDTHAIVTKQLPWKLLTMQGVYRTFYIGASAVFESVLHVIEYNRMILDHYL